MDDFMFLASDEGAFTSWSGEGLLPMGLQPDGAGALTFFTEMGEGVLQLLVTFGELLVFLTGEGELWLLFLKWELFPPFLAWAAVSMLCLVGVGVFLGGDGELLPLFAGEGELSRLPFDNEDL